MQMFTLETSAGIDKRDLFLWDNVWTGPIVNLKLREYIVNKKMDVMYIFWKVSSHPLFKYEVDKRMKQTSTKSSDCLAWN